MVIPMVPPESLFWQGLADCDYFPTSSEIEEADICKIVGVSPTLGLSFIDEDIIELITTFKIKRLTKKCMGSPFSMLFIISRKNI